jgi:ABC-type lipoprotein export system ATPase subunit
VSALVTMRNVHKVYQRGSEQIEVLEGVNLDIQAGDFLVLMGPSGSGKTTLLNLLGGLDRLSEGTIEVGDARLDQLSGTRLARWRAAHVGFVFQLYNLLPVLTAERNVELPLLLTRLSRAERKTRARLALKVVGSPIAPDTTLASFQAARNSASASRGRSWPTRPCCCVTSRRAISTAGPEMTSSNCFGSSTANTARPS